MSYKKILKTDGTFSFNSPQQPRLAAVESTKCLKYAAEHFGDKQQLAKSHLCQICFLQLINKNYERTSGGLMTNRVGSKALQIHYYKTNK